MTTDCHDVNNKFSYVESGMAWLFQSDNTLSIYAYDLGTSVHNEHDIQFFATQSLIDFNSLMKCNIEMVNVF